MFSVSYGLLLLPLCITVLSRSVTEDEPLILTPLIEAGKLDEARKLSVVDPTLFAGVASHSGYITVNKTAASHLFFWFFPVEDKPLATTPWLIWLQGGPGGSSLYGLFTEIGPIFIDSSENARQMNITWASDYSLLFIDNPVGTGFSFSENNEYVTNEDQVGECLLNLLQQLLQVFPELRQAPLFISGESYAGKYIPALGHYIHNNKNDSYSINLRGLAIGDGWTDPPTLMEYSKFGLQIGVLDPEQAAEIQNYEDAAKKAYSKNNMETYVKNAKKVMSSFAILSGTNAYNYIADITRDGRETLVNYLNKEEVQRALHVGKRIFQMSSIIVSEALANDFYQSVKEWLEELVEHYGVLCYNGQLDVIVAYPLSVNTYRSLQWSGAENYKKAKREKIYDNINTFKINSYKKGYGNFMEMLVRKAGHMVPADQPIAAKQMIDLFIEQFKA